MVGASFRDEAKRRQIRSAPNLPSTSGVASGSVGSGDRLGVAALPNVNFSPVNQPGRTTGGDPGRRSNRPSGGAGGNSGGHYAV